MTSLKCQQSVGHLLLTLIVEPRVFMRILAINRSVIQSTLIRPLTTLPTQMVDACLDG